MPKESEKAEDEGCCALQRRVDRKWWCERCLAGRWGQRCDNKALWKRLDAASMQKYYNGCHECAELPAVRSSAEVATKVITKQLEKEQAGDPKPVQRKTQEQLHGKQHGCRTGSAGLTSPPPAPRPATTMSPPDKAAPSRWQAHWCSLREKHHSTFEKLHRGILNLPKLRRLRTALWDDPLKRQWAVGIYKGCLEKGFTIEIALDVTANVIKHKESGKAVHIDTIRDWVKQWAGTWLGAERPVVQDRKARWALAE